MNQVYINGKWINVDCVAGRAMYKALNANHISDSIIDKVLLSPAQGNVTVVDHNYKYVFGASNSFNSKGFNTNHRATSISYQSN